jgi:hypothetical protein
MAPDPVTWAGPRAPCGKKGQHIPVSIKGGQTPTGGHQTSIRIRLELPSEVRTSARSQYEEDLGVGRGPVLTRVQALPFTSRLGGDTLLVAHDIRHRAEPDVSRLAPAFIEEGTRRLPLR